MRSILKILAFTALLLISKFTKEEKLTTPAESPQVIVSSVQNQIPVHKTASKLPEEPVQPFMTTEATIK